MASHSSSLLIQIIGRKKLARILEQSDITSNLFSALNLSFGKWFKRCHICRSDFFYLRDEDNLLHPTFKYTWGLNIRSWLCWCYLIHIVSRQILVASWVISCVCKLWDVIWFYLWLSESMFAVIFYFFCGFHLSLTGQVGWETWRTNSTININFNFPIVNSLTVSKGNFLLFNNWSKIGLIFGNIKVAMMLLSDHLRSFIPIDELWQNSLWFWASLIRLRANKSSLVSLDRSSHIWRDPLLRRDALLRRDTLFWRDPLQRAIPRLSLDIPIHPRVRISLLDPKVHAFVVNSLLCLFLLHFLSILLADLHSFKTSSQQVLVIFH